MIHTIETTVDWPAERAPLGVCYGVCGLRERVNEMYMQVMHRHPEWSLTRCKLRAQIEALKSPA